MIADALDARHVVKVAVGQGLVEVTGREVEVQPLRQQGQVVDQRRQLVVSRSAIFRLGHGAPDHREREVGDLHLVRVAAQLGDLRLHRGVMLDSGIKPHLADEQQLAPTGRKGSAPAALASLDDDRMPLWRARHRERTSRGEPLPLMIEPMHPIAVGVHPARPVSGDGVGLPGVPVAVHDFHELVGSVIPLVMGGGLVQTHVAGLVVVD